jgi:hypothetical protein
MKIVEKVLFLVSKLLFKKIRFTLERASTYKSFGQLLNTYFSHHKLIQILPEGLCRQGLDAP